MPQRDSFSHAATSQEQAPFLRSPPAHSPPRPRSSARWCRDKFLSRSVLREVGDLREYFRRSLRDGGFASGARGEGAENANAGVDGVVHACVMAGLAGGGENVARWSRAEGVFCGKDKVALHGSSVLSEKDWGAGGGDDRLVVFGEKFSGAKSTWLNMAAVVDPLAMLLVGGEGGGGGDDVKVEFVEGRLLVDGWGAGGVRCNARIGAGLRELRSAFGAEMEGFWGRKDGRGGGDLERLVAEEEGVVRLVLQLIKHN